MAITFLEKRKIQKHLVFILGITLLIVVLIVWQGFFVKEKPIFLGEIVKPEKKVEINFEILESPILKGLQPFEEIEPIGEEVEIGRENPFVPY